MVQAETATLRDNRFVFISVCQNQHTSNTSFTLLCYSMENIFGEPARLEWSQLAQC